MLDQRHIPLPKLNGLSPFVLEKHEIPDYWFQLQPLLERAVEHSQGMLTVGALRDLLLSGEATCFGTSRDGEIIVILVAQMVNYTTYRVGRVIAAAGAELRSATRWIDVLEEWAFSQGAVELEAWCRPVMVRMLQDFGWTPKVTIVTRDLRRRLQ